MLLAVLVVVAVLTLAAYQFSEMMTAEYKAADSHRRMIQARALAESGVNYTAALLGNADAFTNTLNSNPFDNPQAFQGVLVNASDQPRRRGRFSIIAPLGPDDTPGTPPYRFGVLDESGKINLNALMMLDSSGKVAHDILMTLPNMTEDVVNAILDWMDADNDPRANGAEDEYYMTLPTPYHCKNGPLDTLEELLLVKGVTPQLLYGNDLNHNGILDPEEMDGSSGTVDLGWSAYLTVYSRERNLDSQGNPRINVNDSDLNGLQTKLTTALGEDLANYIIAYRRYGPSQAQGQSGAAGAARRAPSGGGAVPKGPTPTPAGDGDEQSGRSGSAAQSGRGASRVPQLSSRNLAGQRGGGGGQRRIGSLYELINSQVSVPASGGNASQATIYKSPLNDTNAQQQLLPLLLDETTTTADAELPARVNVNTASRAVLAALPGITDGEVQSILDHRPSPSSTDLPDPIYQTPAWLITQANFTPSTLQTLEKYITARSQVYRVQVVGYFDGGGPSVRLEAVIDTNGGRPRIISMRDLTPLGKGFNVMPQQ